MRTLFPKSFDWAVFILGGLLLRVVFYGMSMLSYLAIMISLYQFILLFTSVRFIIPTRYLLGSFMCIQFFIGPTLAYNGLDQYQYFAYIMQVPETEYFLYAIPAVCAFILGVHLNAGPYRGEIIDQQRVKYFIDKNPFLPYTFIIIGFLASVVGGYFGSELAFVFYLFGSFKFIGLFMLILGSKQLKIVPLILVIGSIVSSSLGNGMFHDLITWFIFTAAIFAIKYKFNFRTKIIGLSAFVFIALTIQLLKSSYRSETGSGEVSGGAETFARLYEKKSGEGGVFNFNSLAEANVRINQGFIITNIMQTVPDKVDFQNGAEMYQIFEAAILPRILAPNKLNAGDRTIFTKYSRIPLTTGTSMGLSSLGDAYINWGVIGGTIFMFFLGALYCEVLNAFHKYSKDYPVLILFTALVFYYPIRPDCELQTILGHLFKSCFLIFVVMQVWRYIFYVPRQVMLRKPVAA